MVKIFDRLINLVTSKWNKLNSFEVGDIIWARGYVNKDTKKKENENFYVIIKKNEKDIDVLECSSKLTDNAWKILRFLLSNTKYELTEDKYLDTTKILKLTKVKDVKKIDYLKKEDFNKLNKYLFILLNSNYNNKPDFKLEDLTFNLNKGDVIFYKNNKYYINSVDDKYFYCYKILKKLNQNNKLLINNTWYSIVFEQVVKIDKNSVLQLVDVFTTKERIMVYEYKNKYLSNLEKEALKKKSVKIGSLVCESNESYYVFSENNNVYISIIVYPKMYKQKMKLIMINGNKYFTFLEKHKLLKDKKWIVKDNATEEEIKNNAKFLGFMKRDEHKKIIPLKENVNKENSFKTKIKKEEASENKDDNVRVEIKSKVMDFEPMMIVVNEDNHKNYLILSKKDNVVELVNIDDMRDTFYFLLEEDNCPYKFFKMIEEDEFIKYQNKINELKLLVELLK